MIVKLKLISAACENLGIGKNGDLPWKLDKEFEYYLRTTAAKKDKTKRNVMIMGRLTWESFPESFRKSDHIFAVLTRGKLDVTNYENVHTFKTFEEAIDTMENSQTFKDKFENVWVVGGSSVYKQALDSDRFYRLYLTRILKNFECDTFFPELPSNLKKVSDPDVPEGIQQEHGIQYTFNVYEK